MRVTTTTLWTVLLFVLLAVTASPSALAQETGPRIDQAQPAPLPAPATAPVPLIEDPPDAPLVAPAPPPDPEPQPARATEAAPATDPAAPAPAAAERQVVNPALAERVAAMASALLRADKIEAPLWQYCAALYEAAHRLAPDEPRFAMFAVETATRIGDRQAAARALAAYRRLRPDDEFAQVQQIEAYLQEMPELERQVKYCEQLLQTISIPASVRSAVAFRAARLYAERTEGIRAAELLELAIQLNPLNLEALKVRLSAQPPGNAADRLRLLLQMLHANPAQPAVGIAVAREVSAAGLTTRAMEWFNQSLELHAQMGITPPPDVGIDYAAQLVINGDPAGASLVCDRILEQAPNDVNAWQMKLIAARAVGDDETVATSLKRSLVALTNHIAELRSAAGDKTATTRPVDTPDEIALPDPNGTVQRLAEAKRPELIAQFAPLAAQIAWQKIYFEETPQAAGQALSWIKTLQQIAGENEPTLQRLHGWAFLAAGNKAEARARLKPLAEQDPIAALGIIRAAEGDLAAQQEADALARRTLARNAHGITGAMLAVELAKRGIKPGPGPDGPAVEKILTDYPKDWQRIIDQPHRFYALRLDPVRVAVNVGEPVLVRATATNISNMDLTVGPGGVIHQDLWFDAHLRGIHQQVFPNEAYHRLAGPMVLRPGASLSQVVRLDQRGLREALEQNPVAAFQITAMVMTNPTTVGGQVTIGPAGQRAALSKLMERMSLPMRGDTTRARLVQAVQSGSPEEKVRAVEVLAKFVRIWASDQRNAEQVRQLINWAVDLINQARGDEDPGVQAWATYLFTVMTGDKKAWAVMNQEPLWITRLLSVVAADYVDAPRDPLQTMAQKDEDETVRRLAAASLTANLRKRVAEEAAAEVPDLPATTEPAPAAPTEAAPAPLTPPAETTPPADTTPPPTPASPAAVPDLTVPPSPAPEPPAPPRAPAPESPPPSAPPPAPAPESPPTEVAPPPAPAPPPPTEVAPPPAPAPPPPADAPPPLIPIPPPPPDL